MAHLHGHHGPHSLTKKLSEIGAGDGNSVKSWGFFISNQGLGDDEMYAIIVSVILFVP